MEGKYGKIIIVFKRHDAFKDTCGLWGARHTLKGCFMNTNNGNRDRLSEDEG